MTMLGPNGSMLEDFRKGIQLARTPLKDFSLKAESDPSTSLKKK